MDEAAIIAYIRATFADVRADTNQGDTYFFYGQERMFPFATLVTDDANDSASNLEREGVYRLNIGVSKETFLTLFGAKIPHDDGEAKALYDFTQLDHLLPHPVYGRMYWVCVLNPSTGTWETGVKALLAEAYQRAVEKGVTA